MKNNILLVYNMAKMQKGSPEAIAWAKKMKELRDAKKSSKMLGGSLEESKSVPVQESKKYKTGAKITMEAKKHMDMIKPLDLGNMPKNIKKASKELLDKVTSLKKPIQQGGDIFKRMGKKMIAEYKKNLPIRQAENKKKLTDSEERLKKWNEEMNQRQKKISGGFLQPGEIPIASLGDITDQEIEQQDEEADTIEGGRLIRISEEYPIFILKP